MKGKTVVVTGAATGIGKATADLLQERGYTVARLDVEPGESILPCDVADEQAVDRVFSQLDRIDILVNNAGIAVRKNALEITHTPLGRLPEAGDIAQAVAFLAGPEARCITGVTLPVDSGYLAR